uniref:TSA: Wollemia nobilis Ref_Wollemi_Transcript_19996_820 transcribed RNA sequence n=1 Tax=Wollemia nobilis TaxID=56998 RepID=A0A0C9RRA2_9CONI
MGGWMIEKILVAALVTLLLLCAGMGLLVVVFLWLVWYVSLHWRRTTQAPNAEEGTAAKQQGMSEAELRRLPTVECSMREGGGGGDGGGAAECAVCLELFEIGGQCRLIPTCGHSFHVHCADAWLSKRSNCPICRRSAFEDINKDNTDNGNTENTVALYREAAVNAGPRPPDGSAIAISIAVN